MLIAVAFEICQMLELLATVGTNMSLPMVFYTFVSLQHSFEDERLRTFVAFEPQILLVLSTMGS